jgi:hypothetical protein
MENNVTGTLLVVVILFVEGERQRKSVFNVGRYMHRYTGSEGIALVSLSSCMHF